MPVTKLAVKCMETNLPDYRIAAAIQVPAPKFSNYTLGKAIIPPRVLLRLSLIFKCEPDELVGWADDTEILCLD